MGSMNLVHWMVVVAARMLRFGGGRMAGNMAGSGRGLPGCRTEISDMYLPPHPLESPFEH